MLTSTFFKLQNWATDKMVSIINNVVYGGPAYYIPSHLSFGQYLLDRFRSIHDTEGDRIAMVT